MFFFPNPGEPGAHSWWHVLFPSSGRQFTRNAMNTNPTPTRKQANQSERELEKSIRENEGPLGLGDESSYPKETRKNEDYAVGPKTPPEAPPLPGEPGVKPTDPDIIEPPRQPDETPPLPRPEETPPMPDTPAQPPVKPDEIGPLEGADEDTIPNNLSEDDQHNRVHPASL